MPTSNTPSPNGSSPVRSGAERILRSPNFRNGSFQNLSDTPMKLESVSYFTILKDSLRRPPEVRPDKPMPSVKTDLKSLHSEKPLIVWFGHSSYLVHIGGRNILVDPVFSGSASPFSFMIKAFPGADAYTVEDLPVIDILILTHNHYDHLDKKTIRQLKTKTRHIYTALGVGPLLEAWGFDKNIITEMDWWDQQPLPPITRHPANLNPISPNLASTHPATGSLATESSAPQSSSIERLTATPARHFSGRGLKRGGSLWTSFVLETGGYKIFLGGDSGYDAHFQTIGKKFGPFDLAILECGQYNDYWPFIHMMPEQTVQAAIDLGAKALLPVHWGKFTLANHPWDEPIRRVTRSAAERRLPIATPMIGEPVILDTHYPRKAWWE